MLNKIILLIESLKDQKILIGGSRFLHKKGYIDREPKDIDLLAYNTEGIKAVVNLLKNNGFECQALPFSDEGSVLNYIIIKVSKGSVSVELDVFLLDNWPTTDKEILRLTVEAKISAIRTYLVDEKFKQASKHLQDLITIQDRKPKEPSIISWLQFK